MQPALNVSVENLLSLIGGKEVEIAILRARIAELEKEKSDSEQAKKEPETPPIPPE